MTSKQTILEDLQGIPDSLLEEVRDFIRFLKERARKEPVETALMSEPSLARDWLRPEEDEAWQDL
jgi:hypothetical protein